MKRRIVTEEEKRLWAYVTRDAIPLNSGQWVADSGQQTVDSGQIKKPPFIPQPLTTTHQPLTTTHQLTTDKRLRKGKMPLEGTLDLHGHTREQAYQQLTSFIQHHHTRGSRFLLVITGKGTMSGGRGVLKEMLPRWLAEPAFSSMVLAVDIARPEHGGSGAYYVLLRRKRHG